MEKQALYDLTKLPNQQWKEEGEALVLADEVKHVLLRAGTWRFGYKGSCYGHIMLNGPAGVGKTRSARMAADAAVRQLGKPGNGLVIRTPTLLNDHLGKSPQLISSLFDDIVLSATHSQTTVIWDDAGAIFCSRQQSVASRDPTDLIRVTTALLKGLEDLKAVKNVLQFSTCNFGDVVDEAIMDRVDHVVSFHLPTIVERRAILARAVEGFAGERVLDELAVATEGKSGRWLSNITFQAYLLGNCEKPEELREEDFLRAVGLAAGTTGVEEQVVLPDEDNAVSAKGEDICTSVSNNEFPQAACSRRSRSLRRWPWWRTQPGSVSAPTLSD
jgi:SpoVK/Ycf46/Vps4 family AAA+-type ATPase